VRSLNTHFALSRPGLLTFPVPKFVWFVGSLAFAMWALNLQTFWRQLRFLRDEIVSQRVSYFGVREQPVAILASQDPFSHWPNTRPKRTDGSGPGNTLISVGVPTNTGN
jgi:hypothetical protein